MQSKQRVWRLEFGKIAIAGASGVHTFKRLQEALAFHLLAAPGRSHGSDCAAPMSKLDCLCKKTPSEFKCFFCSFYTIVGGN